MINKNFVAKSAEFPLKFIKTKLKKQRSMGGTFLRCHWLRLHQFPFQKYGKMNPVGGSRMKWVHWQRLNLKCNVIRKFQKHNIIRPQDLLFTNYDKLVTSN